MKLLPFLHFSIIALGCPLAADPSAPLEPRVFSHPDRIRYDGQCLTIDGKDTMIYSGAFHYFRCPKALWPERFQRIKEAGFNCVETYTAWNWHETERPSSPADFSKITRLQDLDDWLTMAEKYGLYVIVRPGPYICAEWEFGGFPLWLKAERPEHPLRGDLWLRTDDPVFEAWSKHWLDAVCPIIAKHQITRKAPGQPGVILFQLENEYDAWPVGSEVRLNYLTALARDATADGIDVPFFTCLTREIRGIASGPLRSVFDCENLYPRWDVRKALDNRIDRLRIKQPDAPLATTELQGGWFATVGGKLSDQQEGLSPAEIQNLTLYSWQKGETLTNYYMLFGGTNFDDWSSRKVITSYDYDAPIREDGGVTERYQRVWALGHMLQEHGSRLVRSKLSDIDWTATDKDVQVGERRAADGSRYIFVRTDNYTEPRSGHAELTENDGSAERLDFDYQLEPFGSKVLYLAPGVTDPQKGEWLPKPAPPVARPATLPGAVTISQVQTMPDPLPQSWSPITPGQTLGLLPDLGSHFFYYRVPAAPGSTVSFYVQAKDRVVSANSPSAGTADSDSNPTLFTANVPAGDGHVIVLFENFGYSNYGKPLEQQLDGVQSIDGATGPIEYSTGEVDRSEMGRGLAFSNPAVGSEASAWKTVDLSATATSSSNALLTWYRATFELPAPTPHTWVPWHLHLEAKGDGFLYLNGHGLGRYWEQGPQQNFFLPSCWLNFGPGKPNTVALDLCGRDQGASIQAISIAPDTETAESR